jgi:L-alanine-DL-glutamate epimerase-like enolase superfamily enzyme
MIQDINIGGVFLGGSELVELKKEDILAIVVKEGMGNTEFVAKILRVVTRDEKITGYGCCFLFVNARQEEVVAKFINKLQVHRIATERAEAAEIVDTSRFT